MEQLSLVHEDIYDALRTCVQAAGGAKAIGHLLWPELKPDKAGNRLADAMNAMKRDVLNPEQVLLILREGRKAGCHAAMYFIADECDYQRPQPIEPEDEKARLQREYVEAVQQLQKLTSQIEHVNALQVVGK